jgi:hypothetical protein
MTNSIAPIMFIALIKATFFIQKDNKMKAPAIIPNISIVFIQNYIIFKIYNDNLSKQKNACLQEYDCRPQKVNVLIHL